MSFEDIHESRHSTRDLNELYEELMQTLERGAADEERLHDHFDELRNQDYHDLTDEAIFEHLIASVFSSGFSWDKYLAFAPRLREVFGEYEQAAQYDEADIQRLLNDDSLIRHEGKIRAMVGNAQTFSRLTESHGSFAAYLDTFDDPDATIEAVQSQFGFLGPETTREFLKEIGYANVIKRDVHVKRIVARLGLVEDEDDVDGIDAVLGEMSAATGESLSLIDRIIWIHGAGLTEVGLEPICASTPRCGGCQVSNCASRRASYQETL